MDLRRPTVFRVAAPIATAMCALLAPLCLAYYPLRLKAGLRAGLIGSSAVTVLGHAAMLEPSVVRPLCLFLDGKPSERGRMRAGIRVRFGAAGLTPSARRLDRRRRAGRSRSATVAGQGAGAQSRVMGNVRIVVRESFRIGCSGSVPFFPIARHCILLRLSGIVFVLFFLSHRLGFVCRGRPSRVLGRSRFGSRR